MAEEAPKKSKKKKFVILLLVLIILGGGGAAAWHFYLANMVDEFLNNTGTETVAEHDTSALPPLNLNLVALPTFRTNLADPLGRRLIKIDLQIETNTATSAQDIKNYMVPIQDAILLLLSTKTYADLSSPASKNILKSEVADRINQILGGNKVSQVFITDMIIQ